MERIDLDRLKIDVNLVEVAHLHGYRIFRPKTSVNSIYVKSDNDSLIIKRDSDLHWVYMSVHDSNDKGSIIDFMMKRHSGLNFKAAIDQIGREYLGAALPVPVEVKELDVKATVKDRVAVERKIKNMRVSRVNKYLLSRGVTEVVQNSTRFIGTILCDHYNNAVFPHVDNFGICGAEIRNFEFKGCPKGSGKGVWLSNCSEHDTQIVVVEGGIDALSHFALVKSNNRRYLSIGGEPSPGAWKCVKRMIEMASDNGIEPISAVDNDKAGDDLHSKLIGHVGNTVTRVRPKGKDWNVDLIKSLT